MLQIVASLSDDFLESFMLLESSIMLLENTFIVQASLMTIIIYDHCIFIVQATGEGKKLDCFK